MVKERIRYFDFLRGIAILMVMAIHTFQFSPQDNGISSTLSVLIRQILNSAVPIFLAISGFFIVNRKYGDIIKKQIPKVYIPCLVWSIPYLAISIYKGTDSIEVSFLNYIFCGYSIYYFVALIIQYYLLVPVLKNNQVGVILSGCISIISIIAITWYLRIEGNALPLILYAGPFVVWVVFFVIGMYLSKHKRDYSLSILLVLLVLSFASQYWEYRLIGGVGIKATSFVFSFIAILILFSQKAVKLYKSNMITNIICKIGDISFGLYLMHCFVVMGVQKLLPFHLWIIDWLLVVAISSILIFCTKKIIPELSKKYLGL